MASTEEDILKTLRNIEKILGQGSVASGLGRAPPRGAGTQKRDDDPNQTTKARRSFQATSAVLTTLNNTTRSLNKNFMGLSKTVLNTRSNFVAMNRSMRSFARDSPVPAPSGGQERITPADREKKSKNDPLKVFPPFFERLIRTFQDTVRESRRAEERRALAARNAGGGGPRPPGPGELLADQAGPQGPGGRLGGALTSMTGKVNSAASAVGGFAVALAGLIIPITEDVLKLHAAGIQASSALGGMYIDAAMAGMSLDDYTKVIQESSAAVTRSGSMEEFNNTLSVGTKQLKGLGIFGADALKLSASLATSTTALGIPQDQLVDSTQMQISTFERLRKSSLLTASQFQKLTEELGENQTVQSQLLGMAPAQRASRFAELTAIKTIGLSMGSTKKASDALGDALIKMRDASAPKRFEAAGLIRQAGAIYGMDPAATERAARLSLRKNRTLEEDTELARLAAPIEAALQRAMNNDNNIGGQFIAEQLSEKFGGTSFGKVMQAAGNVAMTADSGQAGVNADFAVGTSQLIQAAGDLMSAAKGLKENTIVKALGGPGVIGGIIGLWLGRAFAGGAGAGGGILSSLRGLISGAFGMVRTGIGKIFSLFNPANWGLGGIVNSLRNFGSTIAGSLGPIGRMFGSISSMLGNFLTPLGGILKGGLTLLKGIPGLGALIAIVFDGIGELFTQNITAAFNPDGNGGIKEIFGNVVFAIFNGFIGSIGWLMDKVVGLFGGEGFGIENAFNRFAVLMKLGFMSSLASIVKVIPGIGGKMSEYFEKAAEDSAAVLKQLNDDTTSTVSSLGKAANKNIDANQKTAAATSTLADKTAASAAKLTVANAGILTTTSGITSSIVAQAAAIATPAPTALKSVTPPTVNKPETETVAEAPVAAPPAAGMPTDAIVAQLVAITNLLGSMLSAEELQAAGISALASAAGRPVFANNERMFDLLQGSRRTS